MKRIINFKGDISEWYQKMGLSIDYLGGQDFLNSDKPSRTKDNHRLREKNLAKVKRYILSPDFFMRAFRQVEENLNYQMFSD